METVEGDTYTMEIKDIIKTRRLSLGLTLEEVSKQVGVSKATVMRWENGDIENMRTDKITKLAKALRCTPAYLMGWVEAPNITCLSNESSKEKIIEFDELGEIKAGYNGEINEIPTGEKIPIPSSMLHGRPASDFFTLRVSGNSMYPRLLDGDTILCLRCNSVDNGSVAVVLYNGNEATVKKVHYVPGEDWLELIPFNPEYPVKRISGADLELCRIQGKVVKLIRDM